MRRILYLSSVFFILSCSSHIKFDNTKKFSFEHAYFIEWTAGIKGGGSGYNLFFELNEDFHINQSIQFEGVYFRNKYSEVKIISSRKIQAFIKSDRNSQAINPELNKGNDIPSQVINKDFPFKLNDSQAVIFFLEKNKKKYYKLTLTQRDAENYSM